MAAGRTKRDIASVPRSPGHFVATIHPGRGQKDLSGLNAMGLDRLPDPDGAVRAFVTVEECITLVEAGYEVRLEHHYPIEPVDPNLIASDEEAKRWLADRFAAIKPAATQPKPPQRKTR
jgi:hypothetical protein